jgi:hypothetical protein
MTAKMPKEKIEYATGMQTVCRSLIVKWHKWLWYGQEAIDYDRRCARPNAIHNVNNVRLVKKIIMLTEGPRQVKWQILCMTSHSMCKYCNNGYVGINAAGISVCSTLKNYNVDVMKAAVVACILV